jgi:NAD(P)H-quinone oxidoreductase subunit 5
MISIIGFVVVKFSNNYLDGDANQGRFIGRLAATLASVQLLVVSGNLGILLISWIFTSISLHRLLVFYSDRPGAIVAARKKFIVARLADACLLIAFGILYFQFNTGNLESIFRQINSDAISSSLEIASILIALAAFLKSAQFPTHGWLIEVMETPTPVSALLHAGLLNAGPVLLIRMAHLMEVSSYAPVLIIIVGGFTALFASSAFLTQTSIKTSLGYSSVAHMGFSLLVCGIGAYSVALLHLVAHSFYKAHAFLSSGSIIEVMRISKIKSSKRTGSIIKIILSIILATFLFTVIAFVWGVDLTKDISLLLVGGVIVMGLSTLFATALDSNESNFAALFRTAILAIIVAVSFFTLESGSTLLLKSQLPETSGMSSLEITMFIILLIVFGAVAIIQILAPTFSVKPFYRRLAIHLRNGFYANAIFDRMTNALNVQGKKDITLKNY